jgi:hypothetical protein
LLYDNFIKRLLEVVGFEWRKKHYEKLYQRRNH